MRRSPGNPSDRGFCLEQEYNLLFDVRNEERRTRSGCTVDQVADRPPHRRYLFDRAEELRTADALRRARDEPDVPVVGTKRSRSHQTRIDQVDGDTLPTDKAVRAREPDLKPVPGRSEERRVGKERITR